MWGEVLISDFTMNGDSVTGISSRVKEVFTEVP